MSELPGSIDSVQVAVAELVGVADMYKRMQDMCWVKCIANVKDGQLSAGENSCIDRCVNKYGDVHALVGNNLHNAVQKATGS